MYSRTRAAQERGVAMMQVIVVAALLIVLAAVAHPIYRVSQNKGQKAAALVKMQKLGGGIGNFCAQNDGLLPLEESESGKNDWKDTTEPAAEKAWYNALPKAAGLKSLAEYAREGGAGFYTKESAFFVEAAAYPKSKMSKPRYAVAWNTKLQQKDDTTGKKPVLKLDKVQHPSRTVALLEQGLSGEPRALKIQKKYDGDDCKASARQFVARYRGEGLLVFLDGSARSVKAAEILEGGTEGGSTVWNVNDSSVPLWCADPAQNPN